MSSIRDLPSECPNCKADLTEFQAMKTPPSFCLHCKFPLVLVAGKYRLMSILGEGGFGTVYYAEHVHLERNAQRVVKVLKPEMFEQEGMDKRFYREVQLTSDLSQRNENIVRIYDDFGEIPNVGHFYIMEYLEGKQLDEYTYDVDNLPSIEWCLQVFEQLCDAMDAAHEENVIHRDLKPENLLLVKRRKNPFFLKILDFGIAKSTEGNLGATRLTQGALGTPYYMAPEQGTNKNIDNRTDLYSMAVILYEMLTGYNPFVPPGRENISALELMTCHLMMDPPSLQEMRPERNIPDALNQVVLKALSKKPEDRFQTAALFWEAIENCINPELLVPVKSTKSTMMFSESIKESPAAPAPVPIDIPRVSNERNLLGSSTKKRGYTREVGGGAVSGRDSTDRSAISNIGEVDLQERRASQSLPSLTSGEFAPISSGAEYQEATTATPNPLLNQNIDEEVGEDSISKVIAQSRAAAVNQALDFPQDDDDLASFGKNKKSSLPMIIVILLLVGGVAAYFMTRKNDKEASPPNIAFKGNSKKKKALPAIRKLGSGEPKRREPVRRKVVKRSRKRRVVRSVRRRIPVRRPAKRRLIDPAKTPPESRDRTKPPVRRKKRRINQLCHIGTYIYLKIRPFTRKTKVTVPGNKLFRVRGGYCLDPKVKQVIIDSDGYHGCLFDLPKRKRLRIYARLKIEKEEGDEPAQDYCIRRK